MQAKKTIPSDCRENLTFVGVFRPSETKNRIVANDPRHGFDQGVPPGDAKAYRQPGHQL